MRKALLLLILTGMLLVSGCASNGDQENTMVQEGDLISVNYIGQLEDGTIFDTSLEDVAKEAGQHNPARGYEPLEFTVGAGQMIAGFDKGVIGMTINEEKTVTIPAADAYGEYDEELVQPVPRTQLKEMGIEPEVGMPLFTQMVRSLLLEWMRPTPMLTTTTTLQERPWSSRSRWSPLVRTEHYIWKKKRK